CRVLSITWGPWDGGKVTPALRQLFESEDMGIIPLAEGADYLVQELSTVAKPPVEIVILGESPKNHDLMSQPTATATRLTLILERSLDVNSAPVLSSHVLDGRAVLPMALMIEWLAHAAAHGNPGLAFHGFDDLRVLKGLQLGNGERRTLRLYAGKAGKRDGLFVVPAELRSVASGKEWLHARANIVLASKLPSAKPLLNSVAGEPFDDDKATI